MLLFHSDESHNHCISCKSFLNGCFQNVYNLHALDNHDQASNDKRDAKNVPHLDNLKVSSENGKRDAEPKNVINLQDLKIGVNEEENEKRNAKNTPNLVDLSNKFYMMSLIKIWQRERILLEFRISSMKRIMTKEMQKYIQNCKIC